MTQNSEAGGDRRFWWLAIAGGVGIVIAVVALIIAISAQNATNNDAKVTAQVKEDARLAVAGVHNQLRHDVTSATNVLRQLQAGSSAAARVRDELIRDVNHNKSAVATNRVSIEKLQASINTLTAQVHQLNGTVTKLGASQQALTKRVDTLEKKKP